MRTGIGPRHTSTLPPAAAPAAAPAHRHARRGSAAMTAMLFLVLIGTLAIGFYSQVTLGSQTGRNDVQAWRARMAAESGMEFVRLHLSQVKVTHNPDDSVMFNELFADLDYALAGTINMGANTITMEADGIHIPGGENYMDVDSDGSQFRAVVSQIGQNIRVKVIGRYGVMTAIGRGLQMDYQRNEMPSPIFEYGIATKSRVLMDSNAQLLGLPTLDAGSLLIQSMLNPVLQMPSNSVISGSVSLTSASGSVSKSSTATITGGIIKPVKAPEFPVIDTTPFKPYAVNVVAGSSYSSKTMTNIYIKAGSNTKFADCNLDGVIYVETPNKLIFDGSTKIRGAIVVQNDPTGDISTNTMEFVSNTTMQGMDALPATADFPPEMRAMTGAMILAPRFYLRLDSNFGAVGGHIVADKIRFDSNAIGTIAGSIINLQNSFVELMGNTIITIKRPATDDSSGLRFSSNYQAIPDTYAEVQ